MKFREGAKAGVRPAQLSVGGFLAESLQPLNHGAELWSLVPEAPLKTASIAEEEALELDAIAELRARPDVEYAHENLLMEFFATPNDTYYPLQWNYPAINLPTAWNTVTGNVKIAVLDSGKLPHPDLAGRWLQGYDFGENDADPTDSAGTWHHGLHVAGILAANSNNGLGGAGICWGCPLIPVKIQDATGKPNLLTVDSAIAYAVQQGARVINMSFGTRGNASPCSGYTYLQTAINAAVAAKVVVVAAAGNENYPTANVTPASCNGVIAVAASDQSGQRAFYSNKGIRVDVTAPGGGGVSTPDMYGIGLGCPINEEPPGGVYDGTYGVVSAWAIRKPGLELEPDDYCYRYLSGTSMAAPHVAGLAALLLTQRPTWTPAQVTARLKQTAHPIPGCVSDCGAGLIDAAQAVITPLAVSTFSCTSGAGAFSCQGFPSGGVSPYSSYAWTAVANASITSQNGDTVTGQCTPNASVRLTVRDTEATTASGDATLPCPPPLRDAAFVRQTVPAHVMAGGSFTASVTMKNTGATPWSRSSGFRLGALVTEWGDISADLDASETIFTGQEKTFTLAITAPFTLSTAPVQWRMTVAGTGGFGQTTPRTDIVIDPYCPPCPPGKPCTDVVCDPPL